MSVRDLSSCNCKLFFEFAQLAGETPMAGTGECGSGTVLWTAGMGNARREPRWAGARAVRHH